MIASATDDAEPEREPSRRLDRAPLANGFLLCHEPSFGPDTLDRYNVAGLCDPAKRNWYPVDLQDVVNASGKLGYTPEELREIFTRPYWVDQGAALQPSPDRGSPCTE